MKKINGVSLFANVGMAETYLSKYGIDIVVANELLEERAKFYKHLYPQADMVCGDITEESVRNEVVDKSLNNNVDFLLATPPCQGMSRHGKRDPNDPRNYLIYYAIDVIKRVKPKYVVIENVSKIITTRICVDNTNILIPEYLKKELGNDYKFPEDFVFNTEFYGVPQSRERCIYRLIRKDIEIDWPSPIKQKVITMEQAIGTLPSLDPLIREENMRYVFPEYETKRRKGLEVSKWHYPPTHGWNHILWMMHTPAGKTAFYNKEYYPQKNDGKMIAGRLSCYRRYSWDKPANTITQNNGVISSSCCVHPGRSIGVDEKGLSIYSDARALSIYELLIVSSLPLNWDIPDWASEKLIRNVIGEGVPPKLIEAIVQPLMEIVDKRGC